MLRPVAALRVLGIEVAPGAPPPAGQPRQQPPRVSPYDE
jgi:hypothetical protein